MSVKPARTAVSSLKNKAKKPAPKAPAKKVAPAKKPVAKKPVAKAPVKKPAPKKPVAKKAVKAPAPAKKPAPKPVAKKVAPKKPAPKAPVKKAAPAPKAVQAPAKKVAPVKPVAPTITPRFPVITPSGNAKKRTAGAKPRLAAEGTQHFSDEVLADFKVRLQGERDKIVNQLKSIRGEALHRADEENVEEDGTNSFTRTADLHLANELQVRLRAVEDALRAIEKKTYGICQMCGCLIPRDRMRAFPFAIRCVSCKAKYEKEVSDAKRQQNS